MTVSGFLQVWIGMAFGELELSFSGSDFLKVAGFFTDHGWLVFQRVSIAFDNTKMINIKRQ